MVSLLITLLILGVILALVIWGARSIGWPAPLAWLAWAIPAVVFIIMLIWGLQHFGVAT
jgi:hypothetical protein